MLFFFSEISTEVPRKFRIIFAFFCKISAFFFQNFRENSLIFYAIFPQKFSKFLNFFFNFTAFSRKFFHCGIFPDFWRFFHKSSTFFRESPAIFSIFFCGILAFFSIFSEFFSEKLPRNFGKFLAFFSQFFRYLSAKFFTLFSRNSRIFFIKISVFFSANFLQSFPEISTLVFFKKSCPTGTCVHIESISLLFHPNFHRKPKLYVCQI